MRAIIVILQLAGLLHSAMAQDGHESFARIAGLQLDSFVLRKGVQEKVYLHTDRPYYIAGDTIWMKAYLVNAATHTLSLISKIIYVELVNKRDTVVNRIKWMPAGGRFYGYMPLPVALPAGNYRIRAYTSLMRNAGESFFFSRTFRIGSVHANGVSGMVSSSSDRNNDFDIQFFPEGGHWVAGMENQVAFKAIGTDGLSVDVSGKVFDQTGKQVTSFNTVHQGMGKFRMKPEPGGQYHAIVQKGSSERRFDLPNVSREAVYLHAACNHLQTELLIRASGAFRGKHAVLIGHTRGVMCLSAIVELGDSVVVRIPNTDLMPGISHFTLFTPDTVPLSERLVFMHPETCGIHLGTDKEHYGKREKVTLSISLPGCSQADVSVSVTDRAQITYTGLEPNILSSLLLTSDLAGYVESPGYYFNDTVSDRSQALDLLMMTQGWSRFNLADVIKGYCREPQYEPEVQSIISGTVVSENGRPLRKAKVNLFARDTINGNTLLTVIPDRKGRFVIGGIEHPEGTIFMAKEENADKTRAKVLIDAYPFAPVTLPAVYPRNHTASRNYLQKAWLHTDTTGQQPIPIEEVVITATKRRAVMDRFGKEFDGQSSKVMGPSKAKRNENKSLLSVLSTMPGIRIETYERQIVSIISIRYGSGFNVYIDGIYDQEHARAKNMSMSEVEHIIIKDQPIDMAMYGFTGGNGIIEIQTRRGSRETVPGEKPAVFIPLGYQQQRQFYVPKYEADPVRLVPKPDIRPTIYWNPAVSLVNGKGVLEFYTGDSEKGYTVTVEGINQSGKIIRKIIALR